MMSTFSSDFLLSFHQWIIEVADRHTWENTRVIHRQTQVSITQRMMADLICSWTSSFQYHPLLILGYTM